MKSNREILRESFKRLLSGRWFARILVVSMLLGMVNNMANDLVAYAFSKLEMQTWFDYLETKIKSLLAGVDCAVPSRAVAMQMNEATAFALFIAFIFGGIALFGMTAVTLKSAKLEERGWFRDSLSGFARPLGLAWLGFVLMLRVAILSLLFILPGIAASYSYSQCWNLKVENPDWTPSQCMAESRRMMRGYRVQRFILDMFFLLSGLLVALAFVIVMKFLPQTESVVLWMVWLAYPILILLGMWLAVARAVFYKALPKEPEDDGQTSSANIESQTSEPRSVSL